MSSEKSSSTHVLEELRRIVEQNYREAIRKAEGMRAEALGLIKSLERLGLSGPNTEVVLARPNHIDFDNSRMELSAANDVDQVDKEIAAAKAEVEDLARESEQLRSMYAHEAEHLKEHFAHIHSEQKALLMKQLKATKATPAEIARSMEELEKKLFEEERLAISNLEKSQVTKVTQNRTRYKANMNRIQSLMKIREMDLENAKRQSRIGTSELIRSILRTQGPITRSELLERMAFQDVARGNIMATLAMMEKRGQIVRSEDDKLCVRE